MQTANKKRNPLIWRVLISVLVLLACGAGIYWYVATEKFSDTAGRKEAFSVNAQDFISEFETNDSLANAKYNDQIIIVRGVIAETEPVNDSMMNIKFISPATGSYVIFEFQDTHVKEAKSLQKGDNVAIKGSCSGGFRSEILGTESISFKRSAIHKDK